MTLNTLSGAAASQIKDSQVSTERLVGENANQSSGLVASHIQQFIELAKSKGTYLLFRPVNKLSTSLIERGAATKGMNVHGKSSDWGPMAGFIPFDQDLSKKHGNRGAVEKGNADNHHSIEPSQQEIAKVALTLTAERLDELQKEGLLKWDQASGNVELEGKGSDVYDFRLVQQGSGDYAVEYRTKNSVTSTLGHSKDWSALEVMGKRIDGVVKPLTADYDLFMVAPKLKDVVKDTSSIIDPVTGKPSLKKLATAIAKQGLGQNERRTIDPELGRLPNWLRDLKEQLNAAARKGGYTAGSVVNHGAETDNPFPEQDQRIFVITPEGKTLLTGSWEDTQTVIKQIQKEGHINYLNRSYNELTVKEANGSQTASITSWGDRIPTLQEFDRYVDELAKIQGSEGVVSQLRSSFKETLQAYYSLQKQGSESDIEFLARQRLHVVLMRQQLNDVMGSVTEEGPLNTAVNGFKQRVDSYDRLILQPAASEHQFLNEQASGFIRTIQRVFGTERAEPLVERLQSLLVSRRFTTETAGVLATWLKNGAAVACEKGAQSHESLVALNQEFNRKMDAIERSTSVVEGSKSIEWWRTPDVNQLTRLAKDVVTESNTTTSHIVFQLTGDSHSHKSAQVLAETLFSKRGKSASWVQIIDSKARRFGWDKQANTVQESGIEQIRTKGDLTIELVGQFGMLNGEMSYAGLALPELARQIVDKIATPEGAINLKINLNTVGNEAVGRNLAQIFHSTMQTLLNQKAWGNQTLLEVSTQSDLVKIRNGMHSHLEKGEWVADKVQVTESVVRSEKGKIKLSNSTREIIHDLGKSSSRSQLHNWMTKMAELYPQLKKIPITQWVMPGTHDTGTHMLKGSMPGKQGFTRTQDLSVAEQLDSGVRYLDLRVRFDTKSNTWLIHHGPINCGSYESVQQQITNFLKNNPGELLTVKLQMADKDKSILEKFKNRFLQSDNDSHLGRYAIENTGQALGDLTMETLSQQNRNLVLLVKDYTKSGSKFDWGNRIWDYGTNVTTKFVKTFDTAKLRKGNRDLLKNRTLDKLTVSQVQKTSLSTGSLSHIRTHAQKVNALVSEWIVNWRVKDGITPNVLNLDFIKQYGGDAAIKLLLAMNIEVANKLAGDGDGTQIRQRDLQQKLRRQFGSTLGDELFEINQKVYQRLLHDPVHQLRRKLKTTTGENKRILQFVVDYLSDSEVDLNEPKQFAKLKQELISNKFPSSAISYLSGAVSKLKSDSFSLEGISKLQAGVSSVNDTASKWQYKFLCKLHTMDESLANKVLPYLTEVLLNNPANLSHKKQISKVRETLLAMDIGHDTWMDIRKKLASSVSNQSSKDGLVNKKALSQIMSNVSEQSSKVMSMETFLRHFGSHGRIPNALKPLQLALRKYHETKTAGSVSQFDALSDINVEIETYKKANPEIGGAITKLSNQVTHNQAQLVSNHESYKNRFDYDGQLIIQLGGSEEARLAAKALFDKHSDKSQLIVWDADSQTFKDTNGKVLTLGENSRIVVVGHGSMLGDLGGMQPNQLADVLARRMGASSGIKRLSLVGCNIEESYSRNLLQELANRNKDIKSLSSRNTLVQVDALGRKWYGNLVTDLLNQSKGGIRWTRKGQNYKTVFTKSSDGSLVKETVSVDSGAVKTHVVSGSGALKDVGKLSHLIGRYLSVSGFDLSIAEHRQTLSRKIEALNLSGAELTKFNTQLHNLMKATQGQEKGQLKQLIKAIEGPEIKALTHDLNSLGTVKTSNIHMNRLTQVSNISGQGMKAHGLLMGLKDVLGNVGSLNQKGLTTAQKKKLEIDLGVGIGSLGMDLLGDYLDNAIVKAGSKIGSRIAARVATGNLSRNLSRYATVSKVGAASVAAVVTSAFDIYSAVQAFSELSKTTDPKKRQDLIVAGSMSVVGALTGIAVAVASAAGGTAASVAGPIGVAVGVVMLIGGQIYSAARQVEEIEKIVKLDGWQRLEEGWRAFLGMQPTRGTIERVTRQNARNSLDTQIAQSLHKSLTAVAGDVSEMIVSKGSVETEWEDKWMLEHKRGAVNIFPNAGKYNTKQELLEYVRQVKRNHQGHPTIFRIDVNEERVVVYSRYYDPARGAYTTHAEHKIKLERVCVAKPAAANDNVDLNTLASGNTVDSGSIKAERKLPSLELISDVTLRRSVEHRGLPTMLVDDFDGDGKLDILRYEDYIKVSFKDILSSGGSLKSRDVLGTNIPVSTDYWQNTSMRPLFSGDVNGDGKTDLLLWDDGEVIVHFASESFGSPVYRTQRIDLNMGSQQGWINHHVIPKLVGDFDGDGKADIIAFGWGRPTVLYSTGQNFEYVAIFNGPSSALGMSNGYVNQRETPRVVANVTEDNSAEVVGLIRRDGHTLLELGDFSSRRDFECRVAGSGASWDALDPTGQSMAFADIDGDGVRDIIIANSESGVVHIAMGTYNAQGKMVFGRLNRLSQGLPPGYTLKAAVDINSNGFATLVAVKDNRAQMLKITKSDIGKVTSSVIDLGDGDDVAVGHANKKNIFMVRKGTKNFSGGSKQDLFVIKNSEDDLDGYTILDGKGGIDTLKLDASYEKAEFNMHYGLVRFQRNGEGRYDYGFAKNFENFIGTSSSDTVYGSSADNYIDGGKGRDTLYGNGGNDTLVVRADTTAHGGDGADTYIVKFDQAGTRRIIEDDNREQTNAVRLETDFASLQSASWKGASLELDFGSGKKLVVEGSEKDGKTRYQFITRDGFVFTANRSENSVVSIEAFFNPAFSSNLVGKCADITLIEIERNRVKVHLSNSPAVTLTGPSFAKLLLAGGKYNDRIIGSEGNDNLHAGKGDDVLIGNDGNDTLAAGEGRDYLKGGQGNDTYIANAKDVGELIIDVSNEQRTIDKDQDVVLFKDKEQIDFICKREGDDLLLYGGQDRVTRVKSYFGRYGSGNESGSNADHVSFMDNQGRVYTLNSQKIHNTGIYAPYATDYYMDVTQQGTDNADTVRLSVVGRSSVTYIGKGGDDIITAQTDYNRNASAPRGEFLYQLFGGDGDDVITGSNHNDFLSGGSGNDTLIALNGNDVISTGSGDDLVRLGYERIVNGERNVTSVSGTKILQSGRGSKTLDIAGHDLGEAVFGRVDDNLVLQFGQNDLTVVLSDYYKGRKQWTINATMPYKNEYRHQDGKKTLSTDQLETIARKATLTAWHKSESYLGSKSSTFSTQNAVSNLAQAMSSFSARSVTELGAISTQASSRASANMLVSGNLQQQHAS